MPTGVYQRKHRPIMERFFEKVDAGGPCWEWGASLRHGYGQFRTTDRRTVMAHRMCWELLVGPIPDGLTLDHLCRNTRCVNPDHLEPVTQAENNRRAWGGENNRRKTHCRAGHAFTPENTYQGRRAGWRRCRTCVLTQKRKKEAGR